MAELSARFICYNTPASMLPAIERCGNGRSCAGAAELILVSHRYCSKNGTCVTKCRNVMTAGTYIGPETGYTLDWSLAIYISSNSHAH